MNANNVLRFLGWAALAYSWLEANRLFFNAIADAINQHDAQIRRNTIKKYDYSIFMTLEDFKENLKKTLKKYSKADDESEDESEDKNEDESEVESEVVVKKTVTKTISKS